MAVLLLSGCSSAGPAKPVEPRDSELLNAAASAQQAFARGAYELAVDQYHRALGRARLQDDPILIGDQAFNLAITLMAAGQLEEAGDYLAESESAMRRANLPLADVLLVEARLAYRRHQNPDLAVARVLDDPLSHPSTAHRVQVALLRAEIACDQPNAARAAEQLAAARQLLAKTPPDESAATAHVEARLHQIRGEHLPAAESFDREADLQRQARRYGEMSKALLAAARSYSAALRHDQAAWRYYRAAVCLLAQEKRTDATDALNAADSALKFGNDPALARLIATARIEMKTTGTR